MAQKRHYNIRTDIAAERLRAPMKEGEVRREYFSSGVGITALSVDRKKGVLPRGHYFTLFYPARFAHVLGSDAEGVFPDMLSSLLPADNGAPLLVVGIGNASIAADALGPRTAEMISATIQQHAGGIAVITPGTEESSGIPVKMVVESYLNILSPRAVITIDALATRSVSRLLSTIQISDTGIIPGSALRRGHPAISKETIGCPVISVGIPTVIPMYQTKQETSTTDDPILLSPATLDMDIARGCAVIADGINRLGKRF